MDIWVVSTFLGIMNNAVINIHVQVFILLGYITRSEAYGKFSVYHTILSSNLFIKVAVPLKNPTSNTQKLQFLHCCQHLLLS